MENNEPNNIQGGVTPTEEGIDGVTPTEEGKGTISEDTYKVMYEHTAKQVEDLKKELAQERESHKQEIIEIMRGSNAQKSESEQRIEEIVKRINKNRRMV